MAAITYGTGTATTWHRWSRSDSTSSTTDATWEQWSGTADTTASTTGTLWVEWNCGTDETCRVPERLTCRKPTAEELLAQERRRADYEKERADREKQRREAAEKAVELLLSLLTPAQRRSYEAKQRFYVVAKSGRRYEIDCKKRMHNVFEVNERGKRLVEHCIYASDSDCPLPDNAIAQKLMIETDEQRFRKIANQTVLAA